jgi:hypothetical protein
MAGDHARIRKARRQHGEDTNGRLVVEALRGSADTRMSTGEILALTRGEPGRATPAPARRPASSRTSPRAR